MKNGIKELLFACLAILTFISSGLQSNENEEAKQVHCDALQPSEFETNELVVAGAEKRKCEDNLQGTKIPILPTLAKNVGLKKVGDNIELVFEAHTNGGVYLVNESVDGKAPKFLGAYGVNFYEGGKSKVKIARPISLLGYFDSISYTIKGCTNGGATQCASTVKSDVLMNQFILSVTHNPADNNGNGVRDDVDYVIENKNFTNDQKELAYLYAYNLKKILNRSTNDPHILYGYLSNMLQIDLCYKGKANIGSVMALMLSGIDEYDRLLEAEEMVESSTIYGSYASAPKCRQADLQKQASIAGLPLHIYVESRQEEVTQAYLSDSEAKLSVETSPLN